MKRRPMRHACLAAIAATVALASAACGSGFNDDDAQQESGPAALQVLIGSSGDAETTAVKDAAARWATGSGNTATVTPAQDISQ